MFDETVQMCICIVVTGIFIGMVIGLYLGMNSTAFKAAYIESELKLRRLNKDRKRLEALILRMAEELKDDKEGKG